ncbi:hypothetical protein Poli38472_010183 [Pythium oligandrum]|uniref:Arrestin C-terminal-like domain-containing protein n=1 Tax=Pythium oligandrum TaxID=41045 RepID=A0A8K1C8W5_PYTOL|nr:hypothetical protein Poli38472_010183 [Pythium oligandrum]|eukprot:TMW58624.1 hypothetical protein Poli38472_010183 [Pythium oligandrum]
MWNRRKSASVEKDAAASIVITLDNQKDTIHPGDLLLGKVQVQVNKPLNDATLVVQVSGEERIDWELHFDNVPYRFHAEHEHIDEKVELVTGHSFDAGVSVYPFEFQLSRKLLNSFEYSGGRAASFGNVQTRLKYMVEAVLETKTGDKFMRIQPFTMLPLVVKPPTSSPVSFSVSKELRTLGLFKRGQCSVEATLNGDLFDSSSMIEARVAIDNASTKTLKSVRLVLYEDLRIERHIAKSPAMLREGYRPVCRRMYDGEAISNVSKGQPMTLRLPITPNDISLFKPLVPTMQSYYIAVGYHVTVECGLSGGTWVVAEAPITILPQADNQSVAPIA